MELAAIADPNEGNRALFAKHFGSSATVQHGDALEMLAAGGLDAVVIGSPNYTHVDYALAALEHRIPILLEKPVATTLEDCRRLWAGYESAGQTPVVVGFVLRYTPFYSRVKELLEQKSFGQILSLDADENIVPVVSSVFYRSWRRDDRLTGGFMVEKCSHDFDILNWLTGAKVVRAFSIAKRSHLVPRPRAEQHRRLDAEITRNMAFDYGDEEVKLWMQQTSEESMYEAESDVPDHQAVLLEFDNGVLSTFTACQIQPRNTRRVRVFGSHGALEGDIERNRIVTDIPHEDRDGFVTHAEELPHNAKDGHHGGDSVINETFWGAAAGEPYEIRAGLREGIEAVLVGLAAEESRKTGLSADVAAMRRGVFGED